MQVNKNTSNNHHGERNDHRQHSGARRARQQSHLSFGYAVAQSLRQDLMDGYSAGAWPVRLPSHG